MVVVRPPEKTLAGSTIGESTDKTARSDNKDQETEISTDNIDDIIRQNASIRRDITKTLSRCELRDLMADLKTLLQKSVYLGEDRSSAYCSLPNR